MSIRPGTRDALLAIDTRKAMSTHSDERVDMAEDCNC